VVLISHRGNLFGPDEKMENNPNLILSVLKQGFDVEIDVWFSKYDGFFLGHNYPEYYVELDFLLNDKLWCHAKNFHALEEMIKHNIQCFWHEEDKFTLTSTNVIWTYPGNKCGKNSIIVCRDFEEAKKLKNSNYYGICSDYVGVI